MPLASFGRSGFTVEVDSTPDLEEEKFAGECASRNEKARAAWAEWTAAARSVDEERHPEELAASDAARKAAWARGEARDSAAEWAALRRTRLES